jgi:transposase-like protein
MDDISDDTNFVRHRAEVMRVVRRRNWSDAEKGRIVAEVVGPGVIIAGVARRHDLAPQQLSTWIRMAKDGRFALPADAMPTYVAKTYDVLSWRMRRIRASIFSPKASLMYS